MIDPRIRGEFKDWRDKLAKKSKRQADYAWTVLARVLSVAKDRGMISVNPCEKGGRLYGGNRRDKIWSDEDEAAYLEAASAYMRLPILLAIWTGQRQGDLIRLPWSAYDGTKIRVRQSKTRKPLEIPVGAPLKAALDEARRTRPQQRPRSWSTPMAAPGPGMDSGRHGVVPARRPESPV